MHHGIAGVVDGVLAKKDIDWMGDGINGSVPVPAAEMGCVVGTRIRVYVGWLEALTVLCARIAMIGRLGVSFWRVRCRMAWSGVLISGDS